jgi:hypothetical protein
MSQVIVYEIGKVSEPKEATNGNQYILVACKAFKDDKGVITPGRTLCIWEDFDLYTVGDKIRVFEG